MESITYLNVKVEGTPITNVTQLEIQNAMNQYGSATIAGEVTREEGTAFVSRANSETVVKITTSAKGQPPTLFVGVVERTNLSYEAQYSVLHVTLRATAMQLDIEKKNKSFQNTGSTYEEVISTVLGGKANLSMQVSDSAIGQLMMQYNETAWEFASRMASCLGASICANVTTKSPIITIGIPTGKTYQITGADVKVNGSAMGTESVGVSLTTNQYVEIGDSLSYNGSTDVVNAVSATMQNGILRVSATTGKKGEFKQAGFANASVSGKMMKGIVQAVEKDKVQVFLTDIDESYDAGGNLWLPYSTAYSSSDGSGFYCMPQEGDEVRVFFPSDNEKDAFAASSVNVSPLDNPKDKKWRSPAGKEILLTEGGIFITCKEQKIYINLEDENGITIASDSEINVMTTNNMLLYAQKQLKVQAEQKILLSTGTAYIDMTPEEIQLGAEKVTIK